MKPHPVSIIIPALNEELYIANLLASLSSQTFKNFEVILVDGKSRDKTVTVALHYNKILPDFKIIHAPRRGVSFQRNLGAKAAKHNLLLFLDSDVIVPPTFLEKTLSEFRRKRADIATASSFFIHGTQSDYLSSLLFNASIDLTKSFFPIAYGSTIFAKKKFHEKNLGFDQTMTFGEDSDYCQRAARAGAKFDLLKSSFPYTSARRFVLDGRLNTYKKTLAYAFYQAIYGTKEAQRRLSSPSLSSLDRLKKEIQLATISKEFHRLNRRLRENLQQLQDEITRL